MPTPPIERISVWNGSRPAMSAPEPSVVTIVAARCAGLAPQPAPRLVLDLIDEHDVRRVTLSLQVRGGRPFCQHIWVTSPEASVWSGQSRPLSAVPRGS